jgi:hypothetical protein
VVVIFGELGGAEQRLPCPRRQFLWIHSL